MSVENVKAFFEKVSEDEVLQEKLKALPEREEAIYADLVQIASGAGFEFTTADIRKARVEAIRELSAEELEKVAGGAQAGELAEQAARDHLGEPVVISSNDVYAKSLFGLFQSIMENRKQ